MKRTSQSGVTLTELMITLSVIGILSVVSIPAFVKSHKVHNLKSAANLISQNALVARQKAVSTRKRYRIEFNYALAQFRILTEQSPGDWQLDPPGNRYELPNGILMSATSEPFDGVIEIEPRGTVTSADLPVNIRIKDTESRTRRVQIYRSGMVKESKNWE